jgi:phospholipid-translocating ATPase
MGCYIAHPAVITINLYMLINTYRWDWLMLLIVAISDLLIFFWTGVFTASPFSGYFYEAAPQVYAQPSFWAVTFITPVMCIFPRYAVKAMQKVYWPLDVDIIREQVQQGKFDRLQPSSEKTDEKKKARADSNSSESSRKGKKHVPYGSVDEDRRPIYPPSVATHNTRTQNGSDGTNNIHRRSSELPELPEGLPVRPSIDRPRPSYDRMRASMDRVRPSFEASNDFTSAARLSRVESSHSAQGQRATHSGRFMGGRLRGLSIISNKSKN